MLTKERPELLGIFSFVNSITDHARLVNRVGVNWRMNKTKPMYDGVTRLLRGRIAELGYTSGDVARLVYMQPASVRRKLTGKTFTVSEIRDWCQALGITDATRVGQAILEEKPPEVK